MDGGYSWIACVVGFLIQCVIAGQNNCAGIIFAALLDEYNANRGQTGKKLAKLGVVLNVYGFASSYDSLYCAKRRWEQLKKKNPQKTRRNHRKSAHSKRPISWEAEISLKLRNAGLKGSKIQDFLSVQPALTVSSRKRSWQVYCQWTLIECTSPMSVNTVDEHNRCLFSLARTFIDHGPRDKNLTHWPVRQESHKIITNTEFIPVNLGCLYLHI